ncbi:Protein Mis18-alpha [Coemansia spiralis]|uniref:Protein Mis18-alpha n=2 Tax=Coemansia TaxID=4863 RepID=A0A9W8KZG0_9FUNG|nr:yippee zinc-binding/DNA-binding /Mis18, centromere assembly-domain-containing protein [Coemansia spiralis]KAJ1994756.1 Protein Mis18-alpha [Coemansia umbellata]KAJ2624542.1 Protein Mis18-alpha [Coemansia sp. RSA 1358]KAJ2679490.1 Protein Mis18-alpha [Coemansia spiralis]
MDRLRNDYQESYEMNGDMSARDTDDAINGPIVFSCSKCRTILGDTFAYVASLPERNYFGLQAVPDSVVCSKTRKMSSDRSEEGSVYHELSCGECNAIIGRKYVTTTEDMDSVRNAYALDIQKVITYELGKCLSNRPANSDVPPPEFYTSVAFHEDLVMVKSNVTAIAAKLQKLEQAFLRAPQTTTSPRSASSSGNKKRSSAHGLNPEIYQIDSSKRFSR